MDDNPYSFMDDKPRILIFTGDGKGKTTAALGMAFRAGGHGMKSCMIQFIKNDRKVGELAAAAQCQFIEIFPTGLGFVPPADDPRYADHRAAAQRGLAWAAEALAAGRYDLLILDEICLAVAMQLIEESRVVELLSKTPPEMCLVLTGRGATPGLIALADTVTELLPIKHAWEAGRNAEPGVER